MNAAQSHAGPPIFLSYRREDSKDVSFRLHHDLEHLLGAGKVFIDLTSITPGHQWPQLIRDRLNSAEVVLIIIGRDWLKVQDGESFQRKLDGDDDWVRLEIEEAIRLRKIIIPVLVRDAAFPTAKQLPMPIRELATRQSIILSSEDWAHGLTKLMAALAEHGIDAVSSLAELPTRSEPSMLGVIDYFYRQMGEAASGQHAHKESSRRIVNCESMSDLWEFIEDFLLREDQPIEKAPAIRLHGQLSPYAPLLFGNPMHKRQLHLKLRKGAVQLIEELGCEFGELLNGLLSYSAGQMVIRPWFKKNYVYAGLYESIVRNSIPIMIERNYYYSTVGPLFRQVNTLEVLVQGFLDEIPNYSQDALNDFGITDRLRSILDEETLLNIGRPNYALFVHGDETSYIDYPQNAKKHPSSSRYLDGDVWVANSANSVLARFIDISSSKDMLQAVAQITSELRLSDSGRGIVSSFDVHLAPIEDKVPDRVLSAEQLRRERE